MNFQTFAATTPLAQQPFSRAFSSSHPNKNFKFTTGQHKTSLWGPDVGHREQRKAGL